jgi:hypothetical protein
MPKYSTNISEDSNSTSNAPEKNGVGYEVHVKDKSVILTEENGDKKQVGEIINEKNMKMFNWFQQPISVLSGDEVSTYGMSKTIRNKLIEKDVNMVLIRRKEENYYFSLKKHDKILDRNDSLFNKGSQIPEEQYIYKLSEDRLSEDRLSEDSA